MIERRKLLLGLLAAPAIVRTPGLLMAIKPASRLIRVEYALGYAVEREELRAADHLPDGVALSSMSHPVGGAVSSHEPAYRTVSVEPMLYRGRLVWVETIERVAA